MITYTNLTPAGEAWIKKGFPQWMMGNPLPKPASRRASDIRRTEDQVWAGISKALTNDNPRYQQRLEHYVLGCGRIVATDGHRALINRMQGWTDNTINLWRPHTPDLAVTLGLDVRDAFYRVRAVNPDNRAPADHLIRLTLTPHRLIVQTYGRRYIDTDGAREWIPRKSKGKGSWIFRASYLAPLLKTAEPAVWHIPAEDLRAHWFTLGKRLGYLLMPCIER